MTFQTINIVRGPECNICGATIDDVHEAFHTATYGPETDLWFLACRTHSDGELLAFLHGVLEGGDR